MASILTNTSAMTALQTLQSTNKNLATTQNRIATGERVSTASDNAAYWSIATGMKAQNSANSAVKDSLGFGAAVVDTAYTGLEEGIKLAEQIMAKYVARQQGGVDTVAIDAEITELKAQMTSIATSSDFQGQNLLTTMGTALTVVNGYTAAGGTTTITVANYDLEGAGATMTDAATSQTALDAMRGAAATMGASKARIDSQIEFTGKLMDAIDRGVGVLVDADMNAESARLSALQTQQQLGIQALSIANQNSQSILSLFR
ncbi:flagellin [Mesorhizobium sp. YIM 152430]|uniref:flagellin N-terminal helical domain-containing protein n=1 Tax=Mesorhizobium sp. YIM 152430 TaxID=3031761 RepID=UPI0023DC7F25|nr:flagellin [Mesorhizobium sp. YIM 152430]MDF1600251.1 flagellin [Mesorhizobium sp. YIM 152430]